VTPVSALQEMPAPSDQRVERTFGMERCKSLVQTTRLPELHHLLHALPLHAKIGLRECEGKHGFGDPAVVPMFLLWRVDEVVLGPGMSEIRTGVSCSRWRELQTVA